MIIKRHHIAILFILAILTTSAYGIGSLLKTEYPQQRAALAFDAAQTPSADYTLGRFVFRWSTENGGQLTIEHLSRPGFALWQSLPGQAFFSAASGSETVTEHRGMFTFADQIETTCRRQSIESIGLTSDNGIPVFAIFGVLTCGHQQVDYGIRFDATNDPNVLVFQATTRDQQTYNRTYLTYASNAEERFFGFGEQFSYFDMKGRRVPIWVSEQGVGRGAEPITTGANLTNGGAGGNAFTSYAPVPFYITSQMRALLIANGSYTAFDLRQPNQVQVSAYAPLFSGALINGSSPTEILASYTAPIRMQPLPDWVHRGAIVGMQGGTEKVRQVWAQLQARNTPIAAFWLQDWVGQRTTSFGKQLWWNWELDTERYPGWESLVRDLNAAEARVMVYASPYLADIGNLKPNLRRNLFQEAKANGYLVKNAAGEPYLVLNTDFYFGMVDLTNPAAYAWMKDVLKEQVVGAGANGWMADFGEGLPYDAVLTMGSAPVVHNLYPVLWARLNREVADEMGGEIVFFNRAASTQSPRYATLFWTGDQLVSWDEHDGIKTAVTALNTSGLAGFAYNHSDIGGYTTITNPLRNYHRSKELLLRWMEMNAFTSIFRTHEGNQPDNNIQFYSDDDTLDAFARWATVYAALFDYRKTLIEEATDLGLPVVRHPFIHYPNDPEIWEISYQEFMLGSDFLIAPVLDEGATSVRVYLPSGDWVHLWSGKTYPGRAWVTVDAPLGQPGVFYRAGSPWGEKLTTDLTAAELMP
ncbi:MAG: alpha-glucosidase [Anaerolineales bacterium]